MKKIFLTFIFLFLGGFFLYTGDAVASTDRYRAGELLLKFSNSSKLYKIKVDPKNNLKELIEQYSYLPDLEYIEPNYILESTAFPSDPYLNLQNYLDAVKAKSAWSKQLLVRENNPAVIYNSIIAVLDTGVDTDHPDIKGKLFVNKSEKVNNNSDDDNNGYVDDVSGWDFVDNDADPNPELSQGVSADAVNHGTIVAGIAAAQNNNSEGVAGVSWFSEIMPLRVLDSDGSGDVYSVVNAIDYAVENDADVINMSFVGSGYSQALFDAVKRAYQANVVVVAAAGNTEAANNGLDSDAEKSYPVCYDGEDNMVIGVAAVDVNLKKSLFSNYGGCVDLVAPGENFYSAVVYSPALGYRKYYDGYWAGTSLATPVVSGIAATIKELKPNLSVEGVQAILFETATDIAAQNPGLEGKLGHGMVNFEAAVNRAATESSAFVVGDTKSYFVAGLGYRSFPQVKIINTNGSLYTSFNAYSQNFNGAIEVASGDIDGDGIDEVVTGAGYGGGAHIKVFKINGALLVEFFAFDSNFRGGVNIAVENVIGDEKKEIIVGLGRGGPPLVKIYNQEAQLQSQFYAYNENFFGGVDVAAGDINGDGVSEIITGAGAGGGPHVRVMSASGQLISQFFAFNQNFKGGVKISAGDVDGDSVADIVATVETNALPTVRIFNSTGLQKNEFMAFEPGFLLGVVTAVYDMDGDGVGEILAGKNKEGDATIKTFNLGGNELSQLNAHGKSFTGGVRPNGVRF